jgi:hypothetical protein
MGMTKCIRRAPYPSNDSILTLTVEEVRANFVLIFLIEAQKMLGRAYGAGPEHDPHRSPVPAHHKLGLPALRYLQGPIHQERYAHFPPARRVSTNLSGKLDELTASPFVNQYIFIADVPFGAAMKVLPALNRAGAERLWPGDRETGLEAESLQMRMWRHEREVENGYMNWIEDMHRRYHERPTAAAEGEMTLGYVTTDVCFLSHPPPSLHPANALKMYRAAPALATIPRMRHFRFIRSQTLSARAPLTSAGIPPRPSTSSSSTSSRRR